MELCEWLRQSRLRVESPRGVRSGIAMACFQRPIRSISLPLISGLPGSNDFFVSNRHRTFGLKRERAGCHSALAHGTVRRLGL